MVMQCCYCAKKSETNSGRTFHQFPFKQPKVLESWLSSMCLGSNFKPLKSMRLCSDHFSKDCLRKIGVNVQLADGSIPTLFGTYKSACAYCSAVKTQELHRSFHKFPLRNPILLQKWIAGIGMENYIPSESSRLCSDHFEKTCFRSSGYGDSLRLRNNAVPTIFTRIIPEEVSEVAEKRGHGISQEVPAAKHFRLDTECEMSDVQEIIAATDNDNDFDSRCLSSPAKVFVSGEALNEMPDVTHTPACSKQPSTPNTAQRIYTTMHDHQYENTPRTTMKNLTSSKKKIKNLQEEVRVYKQRITRLNKKVSSLKDIVSELRRTRVLPDSGLACLDSIAEDDISQFFMFPNSYKKNIFYRS